MSIRAKCSYCGKETPQIECGKVTEMEELNWDELDDYQQTIRWEHFLLQCDVCGKVSLQVFSPDIESDLFQLYPVVKNLSDLPIDVQNSYSEAKKVKNISPLAFAALIRRSLEYVCIEQKATGKDLNEKLEDLGRKEIIPVALSRMSHTIRAFGNIGAHAKGATVKADEVNIIDDFFLAVLEYVYIVPKKLERAEKHLKLK